MCGERRTEDCSRTTPLGVDRGVAPSCHKTFLLLAVYYKMIAREGALFFPDASPLPAPPSPTVYFKNPVFTASLPLPPDLLLFTVLSPTERLFHHCQKSLIKFPVVLRPDNDRSPPFP